MREETTDKYNSSEILKPQDLLREFPTSINVAAPMVRYSKLAFRELVSKYDTHITHTPMMLAQEFSRSPLARAAEFTTSATERGIFHLSSPSHPKHERTVRGAMVVQFAANDPVQLADAVELVKRDCDGVDLNCGCPQKWAFEEGIGSALLRKPELVADLVRTTKQRVGWEFPVSVKIRVDNDPKLTNQLVQSAIKAGADYLTIHGRTRTQASTHPVNLHAIKLAVEFAKGEVPCVGNGDIFTAEDARVMREKTDVQGVMSARGILGNPALFSGYDKTPLEAVKLFSHLSTTSGLIFPLYHRHISYMLESHFVKKRDRVYFNSLPSHASVLDYLKDELMPTAAVVVAAA
ncbi:FMN-linked oxidoreductase [Meredithblackwellia eburnea MCA 4105]